MATLLSFLKENIYVRSDMSGKRVLVVSSNGLFREGLKHLLSDVADLSLTRQTTSLQEAEELARSNQVDVVILDQAQEAEGQDGRSEVVKLLLAVPRLRVIAVSLDSGDLWVYRQDYVEEASVENLLAALGA
jgi:DNA-binding NarL/FixJ family response regulator